MVIPRAIGRLLSTNVRVRFAPSPTGPMHLGGLRTALYNYLFAKVNNGRFLVRIEDTDRTRSVEGAEFAIEKVLDYYGLQRDEGPSQGGNFGPYRQSERLHLYRKAADQLLDENKAYRCFCTRERLEMMRKEAERRGEPPRYDNRCRTISKQESTTRHACGERSVVRFKIVPGLTQFQDLIYGVKSIDLSCEEGDLVLLKSDNYPTYHFASVIDDHLMDISHVLRGNEWLSSTIKHVQLYTAFNWNLPTFVHLPLLTVAGSRRKLSKRNSHVLADSFTRKGHLPVAVINYMLRNGSGITDFDETKLYSLDELVQRFDVSLISGPPVQLDDTVLNKYSRMAFRTANVDTELVPLIGALVPDATTDTITKVVSFLRKHEERFCHLSQLVDDDRYNYFWTTDRTGCEFGRIFDQFLPIDEADCILHLSIETVNDNSDGDCVDWKTVANRNGVSFPKLCRLVRMALIARQSGPPFDELLEFFGKQEIVQRLKTARQWLNMQGTGKHAENLSQ